MSADVSLFLFSLFDGGALLFLSVYSLTTLSDLECDHLNAKECCSKLNKWVIPEHIAHLFLIILFIITKHWIIFLFHLPLIIYMVYLLIKYSNSANYYDPILIQNNEILKEFIKSSMIKLMCHIVFFLIYIYYLIINIITNV